MSKRVSYKNLFKSTAVASPSGKPDVRLEELVRFLARRAAERDYKELVRNRKRPARGISAKERKP